MSVVLITETRRDENLRSPTRVRRTSREGTKMRMALLQPAENDHAGSTCSAPMKPQALRETLAQAMVGIGPFLPTSGHRRPVSNPNSVCITTLCDMMQNNEEIAVSGRSSWSQSWSLYHGAYLVGLPASSCCIVFRPDAVHSCIPMPSKTQ